MTSNQWIDGIFTEKYNDEALRWAVLMTMIESVGDASLKQYAQTEDTKFYGLGTASYILQAKVFSLALKDNKLGIVNAYWNGMTNITNGIIGMLMGETYTGYQVAGIALITAGILML
jgi:multidrug transporter EmrE-like cation transporter